MNEEKQNNSTIVIEFKQLLNKILESRGRVRHSLINEYEDKVQFYSEQDIDLNENIANILQEIVEEIAYYQPNPVIRFLSGKGLLNDEQLNKFIKDAIEKLNKFE